MHNILTSLLLCWVIYLLFMWWTCAIVTLGHLISSAVQVNNILILCFWRILHYYTLCFWQSMCSHYLDLLLTSKFTLLYWNLMRELWHLISPMVGIYHMDIRLSSFDYQLWSLHMLPWVANHRKSALATRTWWVNVVLTRDWNIVLLFSLFK